MKGPFAKLPYTLNMKRDICLVAGGSGGIDCQFVCVSLCMSGRESVCIASVCDCRSVCCHRPVFDFLFVCHCQSVRDCLSICLCLSVCWSVTDL